MNFCNFRASCLFSIATAAFLISTVSTAYGQSGVEEEKGVNAGTFYIFPLLELGYLNNNNIYAASSGETEDTVLLAKPSLVVASDWQNHAFILGANGQWASYTENPSEDYGDYSVSGNGRLDILRGVNLYGNGSFQQSHEDRGSPDDVGGSEPTKYTLTSGAIGYYHGISTISLKVEGNTQIYSYDNTPTSTGVDFNNEGRNRTHLNGSVRTGYKIDKYYQAFIEGKYISREYEKKTDASGYNRTSSGYMAGAGVSIDITGISTAEIMVGYQTQSFDDDRLDDLSGAGFSGKLIWKPSTFTQISLSASRTFEETTLPGVSSAPTNIFAGNISHNLTKQINIKAVSGINLVEYEGIGREDTINIAGAELTYNLNRYLYVGASYTYENFDSSEEGSSYTRKKGMIRAGLQL